MGKSEALHGPVLYQEDLNMSITNAEYERLVRCRNHLGDALRVQTAQRAKYKGVEWIEVELEAVTIAANGWATAHGLNTITIDDVRRIDQTAMGHVDWAYKLCLRVAELVCFGDRRD